MSESEAVRILLQLSLELPARLKVHPCSQETLLGAGGELISEESTDFSCRYSDPRSSDSLLIALALREGLKFRFESSVIRADIRIVGQEVRDNLPVFIVSCFS